MDEKEIPALGRPFELGMLYDCRTNNLIINSRISDEKNIELHTASHPQPQCDFDFTAEDTISAKTSFLDINAELKLSLLCGWIEVNGSAKYLENHRKFTRQSRVTFKYRCRTHFKELLVKEMMSEQQMHQGVLNSVNATHVVTGILYGVDAIFIFDRNFSNEEDELQIHRKLEKMVKFLSKATVASNIDKEKTKLLDNVKFTYHGDIQLDSEPKSLEEAFEAFKTLPKKIKQKNENCVPMRVMLYPLHKLANSTVTLNKPLIVKLVNQIQDRFEKFEVFKMKCNDMTASPTCQYDESYRKKVGEIQIFIEQSEQELKCQLSENVADVTSIDKQNVENVLEKLPNNHKKLDRDLSDVQRVINLLDTCFPKKYHDDKHLSPNTLEDIRHQLSNVNELIELPPIEIFFEDQQKHESCTVDHHKPSVNMNIVNMRKLLKETKDKLDLKFTEIEKQKRDSERSQSFRPGKPSITHSYEHILESCTVDHHKPSVNMNTVNMRKLLKETNRDKLDLKFTEIEKQKEILSVHNRSDQANRQ